MAYRFHINGKWVLCNQEDNEIICDLDSFLVSYHRARYPDGKLLAEKEMMKAKDLAIVRWCEQRHINLAWLARPREISGPDEVAGHYRPSHRYLLIFETAQDAMLFKLHFNSDSRADS